MAIKPICKAIEGEIKIHKKVRTRRVAIKDMVEEICAFNNENKKCVISHCEDEETALSVKKMLEEKSNFKEIVVISTKGLCSFYALEKGLLVAF